MLHTEAFFSHVVLTKQHTLHAEEEDTDRSLTLVDNDIYR